MLDTSTVILLGQVSDPDQLPDDCAISAIILAELSVEPHVTSSHGERVARQAHLQQAEADFDVIPLTPRPHEPSAVSPPRGARRAAGHKPTARAFDALITATADGLPLFTCNPSYLVGIDGLELSPVSTRLLPSS